MGQHSKVKVWAGPGPLEARGEPLPASVLSVIFAFLGCGCIAPSLPPSLYGLLVCVAICCALFKQTGPALRDSVDQV